MNKGTITRIVNIRNENYDVWAGKGQDGYFGNPIRLSANEPKGATLERYETYFYKRLSEDEEFRRRIHELKGKILGCFCKPFPCHGDIIKRYLDSIK